MKTLLLGRKDLEKILTMELALPAVEAAFAAHGRGDVLMPPKLYLPLPKHRGDAGVLRVQRDSQQRRIARMAQLRADRKYGKRAARRAGRAVAQVRRPLEAPMGQPMDPAPRGHVAEWVIAP